MGHEEAEGILVPPSRVEHLVKPQAFRTTTLEFLKDTVDANVACSLFLVNNRDGEPLSVALEENSLGDEGRLYANMMPFLYNPEADSIHIWFEAYMRRLDRDDESLEEVLKDAPKPSEDPTSEQVWMAVELKADGTFNVFTFPYYLDDDGKSIFRDEIYRMHEGNLSDVGEDDDVFGRFPLGLLRMYTQRHEVLVKLVDQLIAAGDFALPDDVDLAVHDDRCAVALSLAMHANPALTLANRTSDRYGERMTHIITTAKESR